MPRGGEWIRAGLSLAGVLPVAILLGLASIPSECRCGAAHPHPHSIFTLPNHDHSDHRHAPEPDDATDEQPEQSDFSLATETTSMAGRTAALFGPAGSTAPIDASGTERIIDRELTPAGIFDSPDPPPPR